MGFYEDMKTLYGQEASDILKKWNMTLRKLASITNRKYFLLLCRQKGIFPAHITRNFKCLYESLIGEHPYINEVSNLIYNFKKDVLNKEIKITFWKINTFNSNISTCKNSLLTIMPTTIVKDFENRQKRSYEVMFNKIKSKQIRKLKDLTNEQHQAIFGRKDDFIVNLTNIEIPEDVGQCIGLGPKFSVPYQKHDIPVLNILKDVEYCIQQSSDNNNNKNVLRGSVTNIITNYLQTPLTYDYQSNFIIKCFNKTKSFLKNNSNIFVTRSDKGNKSVIMYKDDYKNKMIDMLKDSENYEELKHDPTRKYQTKCNNIVNELKDNLYIDEDSYKKMKMYNSQPPRIYGLIKVHKNNKLRPVVPCIQSPSYELSKFVTNILSNLQSTFKYSLKNSIEIVTIARSVVLPENYILMSLDAVSLFTNIPKTLVLEIIEIRWQEISEFTDIPLQLFIKIVEICFDTSYFLFDGKYFQQKDGTAMGNPASPIFASLVMEHLLDSVIVQLNFPIPLIKIYVDDNIIAVPDSMKHYVLETFNNFNPKIQFTAEYENNNSLPFLDVLLIRTDSQKIITNWYEKPTSSGRLLNHYSNHSFKQKLSIITSIKNKIIKLSNQQFLAENLEKLKLKMIKNDYPLKLINKILNTNNVTRNLPASSSDAQPLNQNPQIFIKIPYVKGLSEKLSNILSSTNNKIVFYHLKTVGDLYTSLKCKMPHEYQSNVIYKINCLNCNAVYLGQTKQTIKSRGNAHKSSCNERYRNKKDQTALAHHHFTENHEFDFENIKIVDYEKNYKKRLFSEMLCIKKHDNTINKKTDTDGLSEIYHNIIEKYVKIPSS